MNQLGTLSIEEAAKHAAGNWRQFGAFYWHRARHLDRPEDWTIRYTHGADSRLLDISNATAIGVLLYPYQEVEDPDVLEEHHSHWGCSWLEGYSVRVYREGVITDAFRQLHEIAQKLTTWPIMDEGDYYGLVYETTLDNIADASWAFATEYDLPDTYVVEVYEWLYDNEPGAIENLDDHGGWPSEEELRRAFDALSYKQT